MEKKGYIVRMGAIGGLSLAIHLCLWLLLAHIQPMDSVKGQGFEKVNAYVQVKAIGVVHHSKPQQVTELPQSTNISTYDKVQSERAKPTTRSNNAIHHEPIIANTKDQRKKTGRADQAFDLASMESRAQNSGEENSFKYRGARLDLSSVVTPEFTDEALTAGLEGIFEVEIWVNELGEVDHAKLRRPIGFGMEANLLEAAQSLRFSPAKDQRGSAIADHLIIPYSLKRLD